MVMGRNRLTAVLAVAWIATIGLLVAIIGGEARLRAEVQQLRTLIEARDAPDSSAVKNTTAVLGTAALGTAAVIEQCRAAIRDELRGLTVVPGGAAEAVASRSGTPVAKLEPTGENVAAFDEAQRLVREAIGNGVWGQSDAEALRGLRFKMTPDQMAEIGHQLLPAINSQRVRMRANGPVF